jgi:hypothetical protein
VTITCNNDDWASQNLVPGVSPNQKEEEAHRVVVSAHTSNKGSIISDNPVCMEETEQWCQYFQ